MKSLSMLVATGLIALPLCAAAQTANTPGGSAATGTPLDQTKSAPSTTAPTSTSTSPSATNPSGSLSKDGAMTGPDGMAKTKSGRTKMNKSNTPPAGDVPTYPAPAKDGTPTK